MNDEKAKCELSLRRIGKEVTRILHGISSSAIYRVRVRLYHGWTSGTTQTLNRRVFARIPQSLDPDAIFPSTRVLAQTDIEFGDRLIDALPDRESKGLRIHLPNTLRQQRRGMPPAEKMVDTALSADLLSWARMEPDSIALVFSSDDDLIPPVFVAEAWMRPFGGVVLVRRSAARGDSRYLELKGLLC